MIEIGMEVTIRNARHKYKELGNIEHGVVKNTYRKTSCSHTQFGVLILGKFNTKSSQGVYWFESDFIVGAFEDGPELLVRNIESEEIMMDNNNYDVCEVSFLDNHNNTCDYVLYDASIVEGDKVVVHTAHHGFTLAKIETIYDSEEAKNHKVDFSREVVCKVDFTAYETRKKVRARISELNREMNARLQKVQALALYEMFADKDPELKKQLDELKGLMSLTNV